MRILYEKASDWQSAAWVYKNNLDCLSAAKCFEKTADWPNAGRCYENKQDWKNAARCHELALAWLSAATCHENTSAWSSAARCFEAANDWLNAAKCYKKTAKWMKAAECYTKVPDWLKAAYCYETGGESNLAQMCLDHSTMAKQSAFKSEKYLGRDIYTADRLAKEYGFDGRTVIELLRDIKGKTYHPPKSIPPALVDELRIRLEGMTPGVEEVTVDESKSDFPINRQGQETHKQKPTNQSALPSQRQKTKATELVIDASVLDKLKGVYPSKRSPREMQPQNLADQSESTPRNRKTTVNELAEEFQLESKLILREMRTIGVMVYSSRQPIDPRCTDKIRKHLMTLSSVARENERRAATRARNEKQDTQSFMEGDPKLEKDRADE